MEISDLFTNDDIITNIRKKLPYLFTIAEAEASRGGKLGMEIGTVRERIIIAMLRHYFGKQNVSDNLPITEKEADVILNGIKISIKTKTGINFSGIKAIWTVDWNKINSFVKEFNPSVDIMLIQIIWNTTHGGFFYIPKTVQQKVFGSLGRDDYFKKPPRNTNPRGVEYSKEGIRLMLDHNDTMKIKIDWQRDNNLKIDVYQKWEEYWRI